MSGTMIEKYLQKLTEDSSELPKSEYYLWPRTPTANLQAEIWQRVGVSDNVMHGYSRPARIVETLSELIQNKLLTENFTLLDICCGDAIILWQIAQRFLGSWCYGVDLSAGDYPFHHMAEDANIRLYPIPIQLLFERPAPVPFDICIMLNTYRSWDAADLRPHERNLPWLADDWFRQNSRYTFLTVTPSQNKRLRRKGFWVIEMGSGEDDSEMVCVFPCQR